MLLPYYSLARVESQSRSTCLLRLACPVFSVIRMLCPCSSFWFLHTSTYPRGEEAPKKTAAMYALYLLYWSIRDRSIGDRSIGDRRNGVYYSLELRCRVVPSFHLHGGHLPGLSCSLSLGCCAHSSLFSTYQYVAARRASGMRSPLA